MKAFQAIISNITNLIPLCSISFLIFISCTDDPISFSTDYFKIDIDRKGYITSMENTSKVVHHELSPSDKPSPLMQLYDGKQKVYYKPVAATFTENNIRLEFENESIARITIIPKRKYLKIQLESLSHRDHIEAIQWGPYHTNITNLLGEIIGVARDTSETVNYAVGMLALNDNTLGGTAETIADAAPFQYIIHSPDTSRYPLPDDLQEGQVFTLGGNGISDVAFYAHKEPYYRIMYGNAAEVDSNGRISITYNSRDRTTEREVYYSLIPNMTANTPNHLQVQPIPGVDFIGSSIALWGSPDSSALLDVIQDIVLSEGLPYPTFNGKWVKDPSSFMPDVLTSGSKYDSIIPNTKRLGLHAINLYDQGFVRPDRGNTGHLDGRRFESKPINLKSGNLSHKEYAASAIRDNIIIGRTTITNALAPGTLDASPIPSDSLCYQQRKLLARAIGPTDTVIVVDDPEHMEEIASWEGHAKNLNMIKIGKELIYYLGVSDEEPYRLLNVKRGYWDTPPSSHAVGDTVFKLQVTLNYGYDGLIPNIQLQDKIAAYYADLCEINGLGFYDFDGQEFLFNNGHGYYSAKRFFRKMFDRADELGIPTIRFSGATLSEGSWHYQSVWNVGGGKNMYDAETREWGSTTSQGKDLRDVTYANFFPVGMGVNFAINSTCQVEQYEHIQAISVGLGTTYGLELNQKDVENCPHKDEVFEVIRTWTDARIANAFPRKIKKFLVDPTRDWRLKKGSSSDFWVLHELRDGRSIREYNLQKISE